MGKKLKYFDGADWVVVGAENLSEMIADSTHRTVTDAEKSTWNGKAEGSHTHDDRYYTESEADALLNAKQKTITSGTADPSGGSSGDIYLQYE